MLTTILITIFGAALMYVSLIVSLFAEVAKFYFKLILSAASFASSWLCYEFARFIILSF